MEKEQPDPKENIDNTGRGREELLEGGYYDPVIIDLKHTEICVNEYCPCFIKGMEKGKKDYAQYLLDFSERLRNNYA
jgi:hypothetical protein